MAHEIVPGTIGWLTTFRLGIRNLARHRRRTWITATTVAIAILLLQMSFSILTGLEQQSYDNLINYQTAHAKIYADGYFADRDEYPLEPNLSEIGDLQATVTSVTGIAATTPRLVFFAQISNGVDQIPCQGVGIDVEGSDDDVFRLPATIVEGSYLTESDEGMLLGSGLAKFARSVARLAYGPSDFVRLNRNQPSIAFANLRKRSTIRILTVRLRIIRNSVHLLSL